MKNNPIKRSPHIISLSHDHHSGLLFCWKIKEGLKKGADLFRIKQYINFFWDHHLKAHFEEEEALLFNRADDELCKQGKKEHLMLIRRLNELNHYENENRDEYALFAELLIKHIRFEERTLFPHLETILPLSVLNNVGEFLNLQHPLPFKDNYLDEFWADDSKVN